LLERPAPLEDSRWAPCYGPSATPFVRVRVRNPYRWQAECRMQRVEDDADAAQLYDVWHDQSSRLCLPQIRPAEIRPVDRSTRRFKLLAVPRLFEAILKWW
jgi:hypothetical protein